MADLWTVIICLGLLCQVLGLISFLIFRLRPFPPQPEGRPGVTIIKPCYGTADGESINFQTFFNQHYSGPLEIIFVVSDLSDPVVPLIQNLMGQYPGVDATLLHSQTRRAYWKKIDAYYDGYQIAKYNHLVISDSDAVVHQDYVSQTMNCLAEPNVSLVTIPQYDSGADNLVTHMKVLGNNCDVAVYVMLMNLLVRKKKIAFGHSLAFRKSEFEQFGEEAWTKLRNYFGDDLIFPSLFSANNKKVVYRNIFCPVRFAGKTFSQMLAQQKRFAICQRIALGPLPYFLGLFLSPHVTATVLLIVTGFDQKAMLLFITAFLTRTFISFMFEALTFKTVKSNLKFFWTIPLWDLLKVYLVFYSFKRACVAYHGRKYKITAKARLVEISAAKL